MIQDKVIPGRFARRLYKDVAWQDDYGGGHSRTETTKSDAQVVSSEIYGVSLISGLHSPALDIDVPAWLIPSSTPGHSHLYIDAPMTWWTYKRLLKALAAAGIIEKGYLKASLKRGRTDLRVPWLKKEKS